MMRRSPQGSHYHPIDSSRYFWYECTHGRSRKVQTHVCNFLRRAIKRAITSKPFEHHCCQRVLVACLAWFSSQLFRGHIGPGSPILKVHARLLCTAIPGDKTEVTE